MGSVYFEAGDLWNGKLICWLAGILVTDQEMVPTEISHVHHVPCPLLWFFDSLALLGVSVSGICRFCTWESVWVLQRGGSDRVLFSLAQVAQSIEDHHQEVIGFCRENGFHGLVAYDSDYALCNIPYYFSAHALKLSRNGKSLTTSQYLMHEVAKQLDLNPNRFPIFAALLGRWAVWKLLYLIGFYTRNTLVFKKKKKSVLECCGLYLTRECAPPQ